MSEEYGLIIPGQKKKSTGNNSSLIRSCTKPTIFDENSSDSSNENGLPQLKNLQKSCAGPSIMERRLARDIKEKALAEDPTIFQYDELYEELDNRRKKMVESKNKEPKQARYIKKLMETAERRKLENELRIERQVQKERDAEGDMFKNKEAFVTTAYRRRLEEMRKLQEQNERDEYLERIGDVTKQKDIDGFYRHIYEQKLGTEKEVRKPEIKPTVTTTCNDNNDIIEHKQNKSENTRNTSHQRFYRKRNNSEEANDNKNIKDTNMEHAENDLCYNKREHLSNNIDADSDFSIDDSSSESSVAENLKKEKLEKSNTDLTEIKTFNITSKMQPNTIALNFESLNKDKSEQTKNIHDNNDKDDQEMKLNEDDKISIPKRDKNEIWQKRTVGVVFDAALQRYYERKAMRNN